MAQKNITLFGDAAGTIASDTSNTAGTLVTRDTDKSINVGQVNCTNVVNAGTETATPGSSTAAAGTTTTDATVLPAGTAKVYAVTGADGTKGVRVSASDKTTGRIILVANYSNAILKIYPPSGGQINNASADAAYSTASGKGALLVCLDGSGNTWGALG